MNPSRAYSMDARAAQVADRRERIARAAMRMFLDEPFEHVTLARIAAAADVSHQTVLNHFESKEGVVLAVTEILREETTAARYDATPGDLPGAVHALVSEYERMGDANVRWVATSERLDSLGALLDDARASHQEWLVAMFGDRLPRSGTARKRAVHALHAATDAYTWKLLRRDLRLSRAATEDVITDLVAGALEGARR